MGFFIRCGPGFKTFFNVDRRPQQYEQGLPSRRVAVADWAILGRKLRKDLAKVRAAPPNVSSDDIKKYVKTGKIVVGGIELAEGDLQVQRYIELPAGLETQYATHTDNDVVVRLDIKAYPEPTSEWLVREMINRVQKQGRPPGNRRY
jgi:isoleucyl-tRNA synthetase